MLYIKTSKNPDLKAKKGAFSLAEVLLTLLIIAIVLVIVAPNITKKMTKKKSEGVVYTYDGNNIALDASSVKCISLKTDKGEPGKEEYTASNQCSEYEFTVPDGVDSVNLTLVAGGGGGGGASGPIDISKDKKFIDKDQKSKNQLGAVIVAGNDPTIGTNINDADVEGINEKTNFDYAYLKDMTIKYLVGKGKSGYKVWEYDNGETREYGPFDFKLLNSTENNDSSHSVVIYTGRGGQASKAIKDYKIPNKFIKTSYKNVNEHIGSTGANVFKSRVMQVYFPQNNYANNGHNSYFIISKEYSGGAKTHADLVNNENPSLVAPTYVGESNPKSETIFYISRDKLNEKEVDDGTGTLVTTFDGYEYNYNCMTRLGSDSGDRVSCKNLISESYILDPTYTTYERKRGFQVNTRNGGMMYKFSKNYGYLEGGEGGHLSYNSQYGYGGKGQGLMCQHYPPPGRTCRTTILNKNSHVDPNQCWDLAGLIHSANKSVVTFKDDIYRDLGGDEKGNNLYCYIADIKGGASEMPQDGGPGLAIISYTYELPGNTGGGGAGGGAIKIKDFPVQPGEKYIIRVGKGGEGGIQGQIVYGINRTAPAGANGSSGTSTSIWKKNDDGSETLIYLVTGGIGGYGGNKTEYHANTASNPNNYREGNGFAEPPQVSSYTPVVISGAESNINLLSSKTDEEVSQITSAPSTYTRPTINGSVVSNDNLKLLIPSKFDYEKSGVNITYKSPYSYLSYIANDNYKKFGGFANYSVLDASNKTKKIESTEFVNAGTKHNFNTSFLNKTLVEDQIGYVGGLGGFSGLGGKAGCGGLFTGNPNGFDGDNSTPNYYKNGAKKMFIPEKTTDAARETGNSYDIYSIYDYYENCAADNSNGQSAEFVLPDPIQHTLGSAGAGGGGGGYALKYGSGKGGDGQNGYLMIDWRK